MKLFASAVVVLGLAQVAGAQDPALEARQLETKGEPAAARQILQRAARKGGVPALLAYAEFLDRYHDVETRAAYEKVLTALEASPDQEKRAAVARRLVLLDLLEDDRAAAARDLAEYRKSGGKDWDTTLDPAARPKPAAAWSQTTSIPGPLRSFARMAALTTDLPPEEILPALARNIMTNGFQASAGGEAFEPTEYLKLLTRYLSQARELDRLAGADKAIRIETCESAQTGELLRILGYRMRGGCGGDLVLETVNATRAFLSADSGFPLAQLEQNLRTNRPFSYDYKPSVIPVMYGADYWLTARDKQTGDFIDVFLSDPSLCRLYLGMSKLQAQTAEALKAVATMPRLKPFGHVLDFFGGMFEIRDGKAVVPGGERAEAAWAELAGVSPAQGGPFFEKLIAKDDGWLASLYDALARLHGPIQQYLTEPARMRRFYSAVRGRVTSPGPARPVFRANTDMLLLTSRLRLDPDGKPHVPGQLESWKSLFVNHPNGKYDSRLTRAAANWKDPDDLLEALFGLTRKAVDNEPLRMFIALSEIDRYRSSPLESATVERLMRDYRRYSAQYSIFSECAALRDATMVQFLDTGAAVNKAGDMTLRADAAGTMQGLVGLWQILCRQGLIAETEADTALADVLTPFLKVREPHQLFDAGMSGVHRLLKAAHAETGSPQERMIELLAGSTNPADPDSHQLLEQEMVRIFEAQRLVSLNTLVEISDHLAAVARGEKVNPALLARLASRISEIQLPRAGLTSAEKNAFASGYWTDRHIEQERKTNLRGALEKAGSDQQKLAELRGVLAPFLRDTLVGLNYAHYAPPGAQVLFTNALFVRNHDFLGMSSSPQTWTATEVLSSGWPANAGGRLTGSLSGLPYALAEIEQNFMVPAREQALIWNDLVPQMILSAKIPRWWNVKPVQMHWVGLHMAYGRMLLAEAVMDTKARERVCAILEEQAPPGREAEVSRALGQGDLKSALERVTPSELVYLASTSLASGKAPQDPLGAEIARLREEAGELVSERAISRAFGTPKPTLTNSYRPELLYLRTFPTLMGYSSRIMAESWESPTLYWAALADELHLAPAQLNVYIPEWTQKTVEHIFATHLEDWPAVLRSLRRVGEDVRLKMRIQMDTDQKASLQ